MCSVYVSWKKNINRNDIDYIVIICIGKNRQKTMINLVPFAKVVQTEEKKLQQTVDEATTKVTYVSFHTALLNQESRKDFITITKTYTGFSSRKDLILPGVFFL